MKKIILGSLFIASSLFAGDVLAVVNGKKVTVDDVNKDLIAKHAKATYSQLPPQYKKIELNSVITKILISQEAQKSGIENTPKFKEELKVLKEMLATNLFIKQKFDNIYVSDKEIKNFYNQNKEIMFKQASEVKARHILVKTKKEAEKIIEQLKNTPKSKLETKFIELAKTYSKGPSARVGGELGWFNSKQMVPEFSRVAFELKKSSFSLEPVHTQFGWHIIYVEDKKDAGYISLKEAKAKIIAIIKKQKLKSYIESLQKKANIEYK